MKILIVEDNIEILEMTKQMADLYFSNRASVELASNGQEALDLCAQTRYDFILTDIDMPVMKGDEFILKLKELYPNNYGIIYIFSGAMINEGLNKIANRYFIKPTGIVDIFKKFDEDYGRLTK